MIRNLLKLKNKWEQKLETQGESRKRNDTTDEIRNTKRKQKKETNKTTNDMTNDTTDERTRHDYKDKLSLSLTFCLTHVPYTSCLGQMVGANEVGGALTLLNHWPYFTRELGVGDRLGHCGTCFLG